MPLFKHIGMRPFTSPKQSYDTTGAAVPFREVGAHTPRRSAHITLRVYTGIALVSLTGDIAGPFIELTANESFDFPIETEAIFVKGSGAPTEVAVVAAINPLEAG